MWHVNLKKSIYSIVNKYIVYNVHVTSQVIEVAGHVFYFIFVCAKRLLDLCRFWKKKKKKKKKKKGPCRRVNWSRAPSRVPMWGKLNSMLISKQHITILLCIYRSNLS